MIDVVYYNNKMRCFRDGRVERLYKCKGWSEVPQTANFTDGYNMIMISRKTVLRHRLLGFCFLGLPNLMANETMLGIGNTQNIIDHINSRPLDNAISNLRIVSQSENMHNSRKAKGFFQSKNGKFISQLMLNNKNIYLGSFTTAAEARQAYLDAKTIYHPSYIHNI